MDLKNLTDFLRKQINRNFPNNSNQPFGYYEREQSEIMNQIKKDLIKSVPKDKSFKNACSMPDDR